MQINAWIDCEKYDGCLEEKLMVDQPLILEYEIENPCENVAMVNMPVPDIVYNLGSGPVSVTWDEPTDDVSLSFGNKDGVTFCGQRPVAIVESP